VGFGDTVKVHFYTGDGIDDDGGKNLDIRFAHTKRFDGRSESNRGKLYVDCIDEFVTMMSVCDQYDDDEGMVLDYMFSGGRRPGRSRAYADSDWSIGRRVELGSPDGSADLLWYMENTPCDLDLENV
jgi:hypothetical protein